MNKIFGYAGKGVRIDLSKEKTEKKKLDPIQVKTYLGGVGLATKILYDEVPAKINPLSPENKIIFATGPLNGTFMPLAKGHVVISKSPLTGTICNSSAGGHFGAELKFAGYDYLILEGKSEGPSYIYIRGGEIEFKDARHLWGKTTHEVEDELRKELKVERIQVASIGPAGENLVRYACIINDKHNAAGRGGMGAVLGSKNVKAIAVRGENEIKLADAEGLMKVVDELKKQMKGTRFDKSFSRYGTTLTVPITNECGIYPTRNFQEGVFPPFEKNFDPTYIYDKLVIRETACFGCPIHCNKTVKIIRGSKPLITDRQEFETFYALGGECGISDIEEVIYLGHLCNQLGLDTISTGATIGFAMELAQRGILDENVDGIKLEWGNVEAVEKLIQMIADRKGVGDILAEGSKRAAKKFGRGAEKYSMSTKGMEFPGYDPRGAKGIGLTYAVASRGGCHKFAYTLKKEMWTGELDRFTEEGKAAFVKELSDLTAFVKSVILCSFPIDQSAFGIEKVLEAIKQATGVVYKLEDAMKIGERIINLERLFNFREGFTAADDTLPERFLREPMTEGNSKGKVVDLEKMKREYYRLRGWDEKGVPTKKKLEELGLGYDLESAA